MSLGRYYATQILNATFCGSQTKITSTYAALFSSVPTDTSSGTEISGNGYVRVGIDTSTGWTTVVSMTTTNVASVEFSNPTAAWGAVYGFGIFDNSAGGNRIIQSSLGSPVSVNSGERLSFAPGSLTITLIGSCTYDAVDMGVEYGNAVMKATFNNSAAVKVDSAWIALYTTCPTWTSSGTEVSGGAYARQNVGPTSGVMWSATSGSFVKTNTIIAFPQATAAWGVIPGYGIFVAGGSTFPTSGQTVRAFQGSLGYPVSIQSGDSTGFATGDVSVTIVGSC